MTVDREKVAKVLFSGVFPDEAWDKQSDFICDFYLRQTDAALASIEAQGLVIVPVTLLTALSNAIDADEELSVPMTDTQEEVKGMEQAFMSLADDYNEVARALGFEGRGFYGDVPDRHEDIVKQAADLRAKVLTLIANDGQLIEDNRTLRARVKELSDALNDLVRLKNYKDMFGKDGLYMAEKEPSWEAARKALNK